MRLKGGDAGTDFPACMNCSGILKSLKFSQEKLNNEM
ncbi:hypothetical protein [Brevibacterium sp. SIMBA_078]